MKFCKYIICLLLVLSMCLTTACLSSTTDVSVSKETEVETESIVETEVIIETEAIADTETIEETEQLLGVLSVFSTTDLDGNEVSQDILADHKLTMVNVWATYCGYCIAEMPFLAELNQEFSEQGFQVVGFVTDVIAPDLSLDPAMMESAAQIIGETGANYTHFVPSPDLYHLLLQIYSVPLTFFVDSNGYQVGNTYSGTKGKEMWHNIIEETLALVE